MDKDRREGLAVLTAYIGKGQDSQQEQDRRGWLCSQCIRGGDRTGSETGWEGQASCAHSS